MAKAKKQRPNVRPLYVELPIDLSEQLDALAGQNMRTLKAEVLIALRKHLAEQAGGNPTIPPSATPSTPPAEDLEQQAASTSTSTDVDRDRPATEKKGKGGTGKKGKDR